MLSKEKFRDTYMLCHGCGYGVKRNRMFLKAYNHTALCLCPKCAKELAEEIKKKYTEGGGMIEIIKGGKKRFVMICEVCDAEFAYEIDDVIGRTVRCPCCGEYCRHYARNKKESEDTE